MIGKEITKGGVMGRVHVFKAHLCTSHLTIAVLPSPLLSRCWDVMVISLCKAVFTQALTRTTRTMSRPNSRPETVN